MSASLRQPPTLIVYAELSDFIIRNAEATPIPAPTAAASVQIAYRPQADRRIFTIISWQSAQSMSREKACFRD
jgi:hypothetical protein